MNKPIVQYKELESARVGSRAILFPINHPNHIPGHLVSNTKPVITSIVIAYDKKTGQIETQNTIYTPIS